MDLTTPPGLAGSKLVASITLNAEQVQAVSTALQQTPLASLSLGDITQLGAQAERNLHHTLDGFLSRIDRFDNAKLFELFAALQADVAREDLPGLADRILNSPPSLWQRVLGALNKQSLARAAQQAWEETRRLAAGKTRLLSDKVNALEQQLQTEQRRLQDDIQAMEQLKASYQARFEDFLIATATAQHLSHQAQAEAQRLAGSSSAEDAIDKAQALQSRALALESTLTRLPSDQLIIRQLQQAGLSTLQETSTTASGRFASIKMTLLSLHSALLTQGVQRLADQGRSLDESLSAVRNQVLQKTVHAAANAPGDNRLAQAQQLQAIVAQSQALYAIVQQARQDNQGKFAQARQLLAQAQKDMLSLGQQVQPQRPLL